MLLKTKLASVLLVLCRQKNDGKSTKLGRTLARLARLKAVEIRVKLWSLRGASVA